MQGYWLHKVADALPDPEAWITRKGATKEQLEYLKNFWDVLRQRNINPRDVLEGTSAGYETHPNSYNFTGERTPSAYKHNYGYSYNFENPHNIHPDMARSQAGAAFSSGRAGLVDWYTGINDRVNANIKKQQPTWNAFQRTHAFFTDRDPAAVKARRWAMRMAVNRPADAFNRSQWRKKYTKPLTDYYKNLGKSDDEIKNLISLAEDLNTRQFSQDVLRSIHNLGVAKAGEGKEFIDRTQDLGSAQFLKDAEVASRVQEAYARGGMPSKDDLKYLSDIQQGTDPLSQARRDALMYAQRKQFYSDENEGKTWETVKLSNGLSVKVPKGRGIESVATYRDKLTKSLGEASDAYSNYEDLQGLDEIKQSGSPIWWFLRTLFTNPRKFFATVNFLNGRGNRWIPREYAGYLPWLNLFNNLAGSVYNPGNYTPQG